MRRGRSRDRAAGQAAIELLAGIPALLLGGLVALQLLAAGYALTLADGAAEAGALALAAGEDPGSAARDAIPGWARNRVDVAVTGGRIAITLRPPAAVPGLGDRLAVHSHAWARRPR